MRPQSRGYARFSNYLLLRKLATNSLGDLWRAAPVEGLKLGSTVALQHFDSLLPDRWGPAMEASRALTSLLDGTTVARRQLAAIEGQRPFLVYDYPGGRPLSTVATRAFGNVAAPMPLPVDLALSIAEKLALSLAATHALRPGGTRAAHGALLPELVWIGEEGDVLVAGQGLGPAILPLLDAPQAAALRPFIAPELNAGSAPSQAGDVFSAAAILYLLLTGKPLPADSAAAKSAVKAATLATSGEPLPGEIAVILERGLSPDLSQRYPTGAELLQDLSRILHSGSYAATTFNLAFYLQTLLRADMETERKERLAEEKINVGAVAPSAPAPGLTGAAQPAERPERPPGRWAALVAVLALVAVAGAAGVYVATRDPAPGPSATPPVVAAEPDPAPAAAVSVVAMEPSPEPAAGTAPEEATDHAAAFEEEVNRRLREEMAKLQRQFDEQSRRSAPETARSEPALTRITNVAEEPPASSQQPAASEPAPVLQQAPAVETPARELAREGQLFDVGAVDEPPKLVRSTAPSYPPIAARQKIEASVIVTALISETGRVLEVRLLRGDGRRFGFDDAALRAVREWQFTPAVKDGQRVRTWMPVNVSFKLQGR